MVRVCYDKILAGIDGYDIQIWKLITMSRVPGNLLVKSAFRNAARRLTLVTHDKMSEYKKCRNLQVVNKLLAVQPVVDGLTWNKREFRVKHIIFFSIHHSL